MYRETVSIEWRFLIIFINLLTMCFICRFDSFRKKVSYMIVWPPHFLDPIWRLHTFLDILCVKISRRRMYVTIKCTVKMLTSVVDKVKNNPSAQVWQKSIYLCYVFYLFINLSHDFCLFCNLFWSITFLGCTTLLHLYTGYV